MPRIPDQVRDCAVYIYPDKDSANRGEHAGASGFLVGVRSTTLKDRAFAYAVSNRHVIRKCGSNPIVRINNPAESGGFSLFATDSDAWTLHDQGDDLAVHIVTVPPPFYITSWVPEEMLLTKERVKMYDIGPGDEVFFVGRFVNHEGTQKNWPALRFGNISMMPWEPIQQKETGIKQESFLVEGRAAIAERQFLSTTLPLTLPRVPLQCT